MRALLGILKRGWGTMTQDPVLVLGPYVLFGLVYGGCIGWFSQIGVFQSPSEWRWTVPALVAIIFVSGSPIRAFALARAGQNLGHPSKWYFRVPVLLLNWAIATAIQVFLGAIGPVLGFMVSYWLAGHGAVTLALIVQVIGIIIGALLFVLGRVLTAYVLVASIFDSYGGLLALFTSLKKLGQDPVVTPILILIGGVASTLGAAAVCCVPVGQCYSDMLLVNRWMTLSEKNMSANESDSR